MAHTHTHTKLAPIDQSGVSVVAGSVKECTKEMVGFHFFSFLSLPKKAKTFAKEREGGVVLVRGRENASAACLHSQPTVDFRAHELVNLSRELPDLAGSVLWPTPLISIPRRPQLL